MELLLVIVRLTAGAALLVSGTLCMVLPLAVHFGFRAPRVEPNATPADHGLAYQGVTIPTRRRRRLAGWLVPGPDAAPNWRGHCTIVMLHGWGSNAAHLLPLAEPLARAGFNLLLVDARNHGRSDGDTFSSLPRFAEDLEQAIEWLRANHPSRAARIGVVGHSVGAGAVLLAATRHRAIDAAISLSAFAHPREVTARFLAHTPLPRWTVALVARYVEWLIGYRFDAIAPLNRIARVRCPVLLVHGSADRTVPLSDAARIHRNRADARVRLLEVPGADHDSTDRIEQYAPALVSFLDETLQPGAPDATQA